MIHIAIDTGTNTGIAKWCSKTKKLSDLQVVHIHRALDYVHEQIGEHANEGIIIHVEDARKRRWFGNDRAKSEAKQQGAGSVKRDAAIWEDFLSDVGADFILQEPGLTKMDYNTFVKVTGYTTPILYHGKPTKSIKNMQHATDAALMIYQL